MAQKDARTYRGWWVTLAAIAVCVAAFFYYRAHTRIVDVHAALVERQDIRQTVSTTGKVEPTEDFQAHAPMAGIVDQLFVSQGETVRAGQPLVQMDVANARKDVTAAQAALDSAEATLQAMQRGGTADERLGQSNDMVAAVSQQHQAAANLASLQKLQAQGAASPNEVASAQQKLTDANTRITELKARRSGRYAPEDLRVQQAQVIEAKASLQAAQAAYAGVLKRAPFAGTVYAVPVSQYDFVQAGDTLLDVADLNKLQVRAYFDEPEIGGLAIGQPVVIEWSAKPGAQWHGHILQAPTTIIQYGATRNVGECLITIDDAKGDLLPNTNVSVKVTTSERKDVLSLPREALQTDGADNFVFRIKNGRLLKTPVQLGLVTLTRVEITGGLQQGDLVALGTTTDSDMSDGLRVKVQP